jgi:hypothetical protein
MQTNSDIAFILGLLTKHNTSGQPFSLPDFLREANETAPVLELEKPLFTYSALRYELKTKVGGNYWKKLHAEHGTHWKIWMPDSLKSYLGEYDTPKGKKQKHLRLSSDNRAMPREIVGKFLLAQANTDFGHHPNNDAFVGATMKEFESFHGINSWPRGTRLVCLDHIHVVKGTFPEHSGYLVTTCYERGVKTEFVRSEDLKIKKDDYVLLREK